MAEPTSTMSAPPASFDYSNLKLRALSAAILIPVVLLAVWIGEWLFLALMLAAVGLLAREWALMSAPHAPIRAAAPIFGAVGVALVAVKLDFLIAPGLGHMELAWLLLPLGALAAALIARLRGVAERPMDEAFGVLYIGAPAVAIEWLHSGHEGRGWVAALLSVAWAADSAAFAAGTILKGPKLWPRVSPKKTWSGFIVGLIAGVAAAVVYSLWRPLPGGPPVAWAVPIGFVAALAVMAGDLWESMLKRRFGVKDSGQLIPGHGGLLDRVDGVMFAAMVMAAARLLVDVGAN